MFKAVGSKMWIKFVNQWNAVILSIYNARAENENGGNTIMEFNDGNLVIYL